MPVLFVSALSISVPSIAVLVAQVLKSAGWDGEDRTRQSFGSYNERDGAATQPELLTDTGYSRRASPEPRRADEEKRDMTTQTMNRDVGRAVAARRGRGKAAGSGDTVREPAANQNPDPCVLAQMPPAAVLARLSAQDQAVLERLVETAELHIDHPELHEKNAEKTLFGVEATLAASGAARFPAPVPVVTPPALSGTRMPTLKIEQERRLFLRLNFTRMKIYELLIQIGDREMTLPEARMLVAWGHWELDMRARIVELNMPLVLAMAKRTRLTGVDFNEMISEGNMALLRSVNKFDCGRGFKFSTYACRAILKSFSRVAMRTSRYRGTFPVEYDPSIEKSDHLDRKRDDIEADCVDDLKTILSQNAAELTAVEQTVIRQRFALDSDKSEIPVPKTLEQVGLVIGVTKERVRQIQNKALRKIREALENSLAA